jgi:two-component system, LytTR family, sensor kinase
MKHWKNTLQILLRKHQKAIVFILAFLLLFVGGVRHNPLHAFIISFLNSIWLLICYSIFTEILKLRLKSKKINIIQPILYFVLIFVLVFIYTKFELFIYDYFFKYIPTQKIFWVFPLVKNIVFVFGTFITSLIVYTNKQQKNAEKLLAENQNMELKLLRAQINPHFLFNALNNIYSLIYTKNDKAGDAVLYVSDLLRYVIDDANGERVPLSKELKYIENFISLWKIRINNTINIKFEHKIDDIKVNIPPMILQPIVENCFIYSDIETNIDGYIHISLSMKDRILSLNTENTTSDKKESREKKMSGIGLSNVEQRLQLYYGDKNYKLDINETDSVFKLQLTIKIR